REKRGLAYSVYSFAASYADAGLVGLYAGCSPKRAGTVAELMLAEFRRMASDGVSDEELRRAQGQLGGSSALALEDSDTRMTRLGRSELTFGEFSDLDETLRRIAAVTTADVQKLAAELVERPLSVAAVGSIPAGALEAVADAPAAGAA
ncbi:MAG TPA: insulinase family protein, partial [Pseudolysinimonas sp.]